MSRRVSWLVPKRAPRRHRWQTATTAIVAASAAVALGVTSVPNPASAAGAAVLRVTKTGNVLSHDYKGATIEWTINYSCVSVDGACDATTLTDTIPSGMSVTQADGATVAGGIARWNLGTVAGGDSASKTMITKAACSTTSRNFTNNVVGSSTNGGTVPASARVTVPVGDCTVPAPPDLAKSGPNPINVGARLNYTVTLPAKTAAYTIEDTLPAGMEFRSASGAPFNNTQIFCGSAWAAVGTCTNPTKVQWTVPAAADLAWLSGSNGDVNYSYGYVNLRVPTTYVGTSIQNSAKITASSDATLINTTVSTGGPGNVVAAGPMASVSKSVAKKPGQAVPSGFTPSGKTTALDDVGYTLTIGNDGNSNNAGADWQSPVITDLLSEHTSWDPANWYSVTAAPTGCTDPVFSITPNFSAGRTLLKWEFGAGCVLKHDLDWNESISINLTSRVTPGLAFDTTITNNMEAWAAAGIPLVTCDSTFNEALHCPASASFAMPKLATLESSKWVNGAADAPGTWSRYPDAGSTSVAAQGFATYRLFLRATGNVDSTQIEIADVLPFVGDTAVSETSLTRLSDWREILAGPVTVEFLDRSAVAAGTPLNELTGFSPLVAGTDYHIDYSKSTNPCRIDAANQIKYSATVAPSGCENTWGAMDAGASAFKLSVTKTVKALIAGPNSGDVLRLTVKVKDFGPALPDVNKVAWNSFAYTTTGAGIEFLTAEPIKVGVRMTAAAPTFASLGDYVWYDENNDGVQDTFEDGIDNVVVHLYSITGELLQSTVTGIDPAAPTKHGWYRFDGLTPSTTYSVKLDYPADYATGGPLFGYVLSPKDTVSAGDAADSDATLLAGSAVIASAPTGPAATHTPTYDFGFWKAPQYSIGNRVWADDDNSGSITNTEAGIDNVLVNLFKKNSSGTFVKETSDTTKTGGYYRFDGLSVGEYYVQLDPSNWSVGGALEGRRSTSGAAKQGDPNTDLESDDNGLTPATLADYSATGPTKGIVSGNIVIGPGKSEPINETDVTPGQGADNARANMTVDFGVITPRFAVGNYVWLDSDNDGIQDTTETGINTVNVELFKFDGTSVGSTSTVNGPDSKPGFYLFDNLLAGSYYAVFSNFPADHVLSVQGAGTSRAFDSDAVIATGRTADFVLDESLPVVVAATDGLELRAGRVLRDIDAGIHPTFSLGNKVWHDVNGNSTIDGSEAGIDGVSVSVYFANSAGQPIGAPVATQATADGGYYLFTGLVAGDYVVVVAKSNFAPNGPLATFYSSATSSTGETTAALASTGVDNDDNGTLVTDTASAFVGNVMSSKVTLGPTANAPTGEPETPGHRDATSDARSNVTVDFGFLTMSIGNLVWIDTNNDGSKNETETGVGGVRVHLYRDDNNDGQPDSLNSVADATTSTAGEYLFTGLVPGKYLVEIESPAGYYSSSGQAGLYTGPFEPGKGDNTAFDSTDHGTTVNNVIRSGTIMLMPGTEPTSAVETDGNDLVNAATDTNTDLTVDFGLVPGASIGNYVWLDNNRNGIQDEAVDAGINGVTVELLDRNNNVAKTTVTSVGPDGQPGYYRFDVIPGDYKVRFVLSTLPDGFVVSPKDAGSNDAKDSDADPVSGLTSVTTLDPNENDPNWDLGVYSTAVTVGNFVWVDTNGNGIQDDGPDSALAGVKVTLCDANGNEVTKDVQGNPVTPVFTDASGHYLFSNLKPGTYSVKFTLPTGYVATRSTIGADRGADSNGVIATSRSLRGGESDLTLDLGVVKPVSVGNYVWIDYNADGIQNDGPASGLHGVVATLYDSTGKQVTADASGRPIVPVTTDSDGYYVFTGLLPGKYIVRFTNLPAGFTLSPSNVGDSANDSNGLEAMSRQLPSGEQDMTLDLGVVLPVPTQLPTTTTTTTVPAGPQATPTTSPTASVPTAAPLPGLPKPVIGAITGVVFLDADSSTVKGDNELGRPGVRVNLLDGKGNVIQTVLSDENGRFTFNVSPGDYVVEIVPPAELRATTPIRRSVSVSASGETVDDSVAIFGLVTSPTDIAFTGRNENFNVQLAAGLILAGCLLVLGTRRRED